MSLKVLLLEQDESLTRELEHALALRSCEVVRCADADDGLYAASSQRFDVILVSDALRTRVEGAPATADVPLVVISSPVVVPDVLASLPASRRESVAPSLPPAGDLRETIKNQGRVVASLRADLATRSKTIDTLTAKCKDLTQRLTDVLALLEEERKHREATSANLEAVRQTHANEIHAITQTFTARINALEASHAAEIADRERAHAEETAFLERAQQDAVDAAARRLRDSERMLAGERATHVADSEAHAHEVAALRAHAEYVEREREDARRERDDARSRLETAAMDAAQARMELAEESRARAAEADAQAARIAELEQALAAQHAAVAARASDYEAAMARKASFDAELAEANAKIAELSRALEAAERDAIQQQLARDAAFHDMSLRAAADIEAAVTAAKTEAAKEREELVRAHEHAIKVARDKAIAQTLAVARERKKQQT